MKLVVTNEDTIKREEKIAVDAMKDLLRPISSDWKVEQVERIIRRMGSNITNSQLWRHT